MSEPSMQFQVSWASADSLPLAFANQFVTQLGSQAGEARVPDAIYLTMGALPPPILVGTSDEVAQQAARFEGKLEVLPIARIVLSRERAAELCEVLQTVIRQFDDAVGSDELSGVTVTGDIRGAR